MKNEEWRDVVGYEGLYQVSSEGHVKSLERKLPHWRGGEQIRKERILKPAPIKDGYLIVDLCADGKRKHFLVHRLVCEAFHENPEGKPQVNHINEDKADNRAANLEWCTAKENINYGTRNERSRKAQSKPVAQYAQDGELIKVWPSTMEVGRQTGFSQGAVSEVANGNRKTAYGFIWKYVERKEKNNG